jgi:dihydroorotase-like cyclic amidohydrolase
MNYLLIKNGLVVTGNRVFKADILIANSKIIEISKEIRRPEPETPVIDASGRFIMPGAIDIRHHDLTACPDTESQELQKLIMAEISCGTTTIFETLIQSKKLSVDEVFEKISELGAHHLPDFAFHLAPLHCKQLTSNELNNCFLRKGVASFAVNPLLFKESEEKNLKLVIQTARQFGLTLIVELLPPNGSDKRSNHPKDTPGTEATKHLARFEKLLEIFKDVPFPVLFSTLRFREEVELFQSYIEQNKRLYAEIEIPYYLGEPNLFEVNERTVLGGFELGVTLKPVTGAHFRKLIEQENYIAARPSLSLRFEDTAQSPVFNRPDKYFGLKYFSSILYTLSVLNGNMAITDFVACIATRPAKLMGLYPQKGVIRVGSDADIVIWNPDFDRNIYCNVPSDEDSRELKLHGRTEFVFSKGKMVFDGETFFRENLMGKYLYRNPYL